MITSSQNSKIKEILKLHQKKFRDYYGTFLIEGYHLYEEALNANLVEEVISSNDEIDANIYVSEDVMKKISFTKSPQGIMAVCKKPKYSYIKGKHYLVLENIQDPGNLGTLFRSALAFGFDQILLSSDCVDVYNDKVIRSSQGAIFHIPFIYKNIDEIIEILKQDNVQIIGSALQNGKNIKDIETKEKFAIVLGNEGNGMSKKTLDKCDQIGYIPIDSIESLNVSIAGSIMMYHFKDNT